MGIALANTVRPSTIASRDAIPRLNPPGWVDPERTPAPKRLSISPRTEMGSSLHAIRDTGISISVIGQ
ncbi:hypothetical protein NWFMUON74_17240 [Nocardia wallacei]|uniref:Uncharacterized protein n=1 Tax=Nocardia wallacei TaxID=480035 RepID=A0A7G1KF96_9NOCA|nr:hypothetical protein NWFMUON74_17240 [Nocardia wallacei]